MKLRSDCFFSLNVDLPLDSNGIPKYYQYVDFSKMVVQKLQFGLKYTLNIDLAKTKNLLAKRNILPQSIQILILNPIKPVREAFQTKKRGIFGLGLKWK